MVDALDVRGRRRVVPAPTSKPPRWGGEEGRAGKGGRGVEGGGLAPRMIRRDLHYRSTRRASPGKKRGLDKPEGNTNAPTPHATDCIVLFGSEAGGTRQGETVHAPGPAAVLPLNGGGSTTIGSLELDQWGGVHVQTTSPLA